MSDVEPVELVTTETAEVSRRGVGGRIVAGVVGVLVLAGGLAFAATQLGDDGRTPEEAVAEFLDAVSDEDLLGVMASLDPGERAAFQGPIESIFDELERLEVLDDSLDLGAIAGVDVVFSDLTYRTEMVRDDIARVYLASGTASFGVNTDQLPLGGFVEDTLDHFGVEHRGIVESTTESIDPTRDDYLVAYRGSDGWRVSLGYQIAEAARDDAGAPVPSPSDALTPIGADSPEAAISDFVDAAISGDVIGMISRLSPNEFGAVHAYWGLFGADVPPSYDLGEMGADVRVLDLGLRSETSGDTATVFVDAFDVEATVEGETIGVAYAEGCITFRGDVAAFGGELPDEPICSTGDPFEDLSFGEDDDIFGSLGIELPELDPFRTPAVGVLVHRVDGEWYPAPVSTGLAGLAGVLGVFERSHLEAIVDLAEQFVEAFTTEMTSEQFMDVGVPAAPDAYTAWGIFPGYPDFETFELNEAAAYAIANGDETLHFCVLSELQRNGDAALLEELAIAFRDGTEPGPDAAQLVDDAALACGLDG